VKRALVLFAFVAGCGGASGDERPPVPRPNEVPAPISWNEAREAPRADAFGSPPPEPRPQPRTTQSIALAPEPPAHRNGKRIDIDVKDADIVNVCRALADEGHANLVVSDGVTGTVTVKMHRVPWDEALEAIVRSKGYEVDWGDHIATVVKR
jgi:hypothetical protein